MSYRLKVDHQGDDPDVAENPDDADDADDDDDDDNTDDRTWEL